MPQWFIRLTERLDEFNWYFPHFVFKIRLIRVGFSFQKQIYLWVGDIEKLSVTFSYAWLILVEFP